MIYCGRCGKELDTNEYSFCPFCGMTVPATENILTKKVYFHLPVNKKRLCDIKVFSDRIVFEGAFWYLKNKEFYRCHTYKETALIKNFIGMGYLTKRSPKKCIMFILGGTALEIIKTVIDKLNDIIDKINSYLQWINMSIELPEWMNYTMNTVAFLCVALGIVFLFSKKKVIEISFMDKRICIPQKSMTKSEYNMLYQTIINVKK